MTHSIVKLSRLLLRRRSFIKTIKIKEDCRITNSAFPFIAKNHAAHIIYLILLIFSVSTLFGQTTTKNYDIKVAGIKVGYFTTTETIDENVTYEVNSEVDINLWLYKMKTNFVSKVIYDDSLIISSRVDMNSSKGDFYTEMVKTQMGYHIKGHHQDGPFERVIKEPITLNMAKLYFHEPTSERKVFADFYGEFMNLRKIEPGVYQGEIDGSEDLFYYEDGVLVKTVKKNGIKNLEFIYVNTVYKQ